MLSVHVLEQDSDRLTEVDDEVIVFSQKRQTYFGISGVGKIVFKLLWKTKRPMSRQEVENHFTSVDTRSPDEMDLIASGIDSLVEIGVVNEA